jgi:hypothetical protein
MYSVRMAGEVVDKMLKRVRLKQSYVQHTLPGLHLTLRGVALAFLPIGDVLRGGSGRAGPGPKS